MYLLAIISTLFNSLDPQSLPQHLAFYDLYPNTPEGSKALRHSWDLLNGSGQGIDATFLVHLVNKIPGDETPLLTDEQLGVIENLAKKLKNRSLKGHQAQTEEEVLALPTEEIDLSRALFLSQFGDMRKVRSYEAILDLMALQVLIKTPIDATPEKKIRGISALIFEEMGFRFPPHSLYAQDVDLYTFLPSVLDSRQGVCLGVSMLYLCLGQRLGLTLEAVTPPGHIFIRTDSINIETTARGVHIDTKDYLGLNTRKLQPRSFKEVVGLSHINEASVHLRKENFEEALKCYHKALPYIPDDMLLRSFMGVCFLLTGNKEQGVHCLQETLGHIPDYAVTGDSLDEDYLNGNVDEEGIRALFMEVDETRESILLKKNALEKTVNKWPKFRQGWHALAISWLQLHRIKEALQALKIYHELEKNDPEAEYYLAVLHGERLDFKKAWEHLKRAEAITAEREHHPEALKKLRKEMMMIFPQSS